jgi:hypothetical protein
MMTAPSPSLFSPLASPSYFDPEDRCYRNSPALLIPINEGNALDFSQFSDEALEELANQALTWRAFYAARNSG